MHHVVIQVPFQPFPEFQGMAVELGVSGQAVIGAHDGRVASYIAAAEIALLEHGDVLQPVFLRQVIRRGQAMAAAADDDDVIGVPGRRIAPGGPPALVAGQALGEHRQAGIPHLNPFASRHARVAMAVHGSSTPRSYDIPDLYRTRWEKGKPVCDTELPQGDGHAHAPGHRLTSCRSGGGPPSGSNGTCPARGRTMVKLSKRATVRPTLKGAS
jgi:hypothetical protein